MDDVKKTKAKVVKEKKPPTKAKNVLRKTIFTLIFGAVYFYIALPAINLHSPDFYMFAFLLSAVWLVLSLLGNPALRQQTEPKQAWAQIKKSAAVPIIICGGLVALLIIGSILSSVIFRTADYSRLLEVQTGDFIADVEEVHFDRIPMLDKDSAERIGDRKLGELEDMVSQFEVVNNYTQINYKGRPVRVATLRYGDMFKWFGNVSDGLPAYIIIDMVTQNADVIRLAQGMKYTTSDHFQRNLYRHLRFSYPTFMFESPHFEIDETGHPYWVCPKVERTIGLFGGTDINGVVLVDAVTGESRYVSGDDVPTWVDGVYNALLIEEQYNYLGMYQNGFWNSLFGQKGCTQTTEGYNYVAMHDDVYMYTGITSVGGDESNIGFILSNQRTKETTYYPMAGAEEFSAMDSGEGAVQEKNYQATFPLLLNISGEPTYFMSLKDQAKLVKMFAMVYYKNYTMVATGSTVEECERNYLKMLGDNGIVSDAVIPSSLIEGKITDIRTAVIDGDTYYYLQLEGQEGHFRLRAGDNERAVLLNIGDTASLDAQEKAGDIIIASLAE